MAKHIWALKALVIVFVLIIVASCGGGGGGSVTAPAITTPEVATTVANATQPYASGSHIQTRIYSGVDDTAPIPNGTVIALAEGEAKTFCASSYGKVLQPSLPVGYLEEELTMIPGMKFVVAFKGLDEGNMGITGEMTFSTSLIVISSEDLPRGGRYELSFRAMIAPADLLSFINGRILAQREQQELTGDTGGNGGGNNDGWLWGGLGLLVGLAICPTDAAGITLTRSEGEVVPPPTITLAISGPAEAEAGDQVVIQVVSNCPEGWEASWAGGGSESGNGNGSFGITMPAHDLVVTVNDGCGNSKAHIVHLTVNPPPANKPPVAILTANPTSGDAPLTVHVDGSGSYDSDGTIVEYKWYFYGGGGTATVGGITMDHAYDTPGTYSIWLRVTDDDGATAMSAMGVTVTVNAPPVDQYDGATASITPQNPVLNSVTGDEQQFVVRIYASDGLTQLPIPSGATVVWDSSVPGSIHPDTGYFYSVLSGTGTIDIRAVIAWAGHELIGETTVQVN